MGRFLIVVPPLAGHTNPTVPLGRELQRRGHAVAWAGHREVVPELLPHGATFIAAAEAVPPDVVAATERRAQKGTGGIGGFKTLWADCMLPVARQMVPGVAAAVDRFAPDVLVVDQHALGGAAVAEARGLPWATSATTSADLVDPLEGLPKVSAWLHEQMRDVLLEAGVDPARAGSLDPRFSPYLVLAFTIAELVGPIGSVPAHHVFVGPSIGDRPDDTPFPFEWLEGARRRILVSLGTWSWRAGERFFAVAAEAVSAIDVRAVFIAPPDLVPGAPGNVHVAPRVPQLALLPHLDAVVCHGGHNTVCESLAHGLPLVVAAVRDDQPIIADQVVGVGAAVRVKFNRVTAPMLRQAIESVLVEPVYRAAAEKVRASFANAGGPPAAVDHLEKLLGAPPAGDTQVRAAVTKGP